MGSSRFDQSDMRRLNDDRSQNLTERKRFGSEVSFSEAPDQGWTERKKPEDFEEEEEHFTFMGENGQDKIEARFAELRSPEFGEMRRLDLERVKEESKKKTKKKKKK